MSTAASSEFMALCRAQLRLLAEGLGASLSVVYMTEELEGGGESKLLPIVVYPETGAVRSETIAQIAAGAATRSQPRSPSTPTSQERFDRPPIEKLSKLSPKRSSRQIASKESQRQAATIISPAATDESQNQRHQILLPLVSDGTILGLLATTRETQPWNSAEQLEIQHIAQTIALAGILDRRQQWLASELTQQRELRLQQQNLLHNLLHQLRNPLTAIRTFGKLLIKRLQPEDVNRGVANSIVLESDRLQELLKHLESAIDTPAIAADASDDLHPVKNLTAATTQTPPPSANLLLPDANFRIESCQLTDVLDPLITSAEAIAQDRDLTFYAHIPRDLPLIQAHPAALREVLSNLIDNALKYTPAGGEVDVDVEMTEVPKDKEGVSCLQICVRDTGLGIPPQDLEKLFTRHYRGVQAQGSIAGTGLGLAIAKELVAHMNGRIEVVSPPPGSDRGTEFMLWLQLARE